MTFVETNKSKFWFHCSLTHMHTSTDSSRTAPVMYGLAPVLLRPPQQDNDKEETKSEKEAQTQVKISACSLPVSCSPLTSLPLRTAEYSFMGSLIIREVIKDLIPKGIKMAKVVMLAGTR